MTYEIRYRPGVGQTMKKLPGETLKRVDRAIQALASNPRPRGCTKLVGRFMLWRIRVGDWRIIYEINDADHWVDIRIVAHRRESYRGF